MSDIKVTMKDYKTVITIDNVPEFKWPDSMWITWHTLTKDIVVKVDEIAYIEVIPRENNLS